MLEQTIKMKDGDWTILKRGDEICIVDPHGLKLYQEKMAKKKEQTKATSLSKKQEKEALKASAAAKLTPAERKALGL